MAILQFNFKIKKELRCQPYEKQSFYQALSTRKSFFLQTVIADGLLSFYYQ